MLDHVSLDVDDGEFVVLFGPNACGKTTLLNAIAGLLPLDAGEIRIGERKPGEATIAYIFQDYRDTLLPWYTVLENIAYPLRLAGVGRKERKKRCRDLMAQMEIDLPEQAWPRQLSGGQQQLLAVARALILRPELMLFDEPFSALDIDSRIQMRAKLQDLSRRSGVTILFVSHELDEALLLADRLAILSRRPARVLEVLKVPFPRPRTQAILEENEFFGLRRRALRLFRGAIGQ